ncbi:prolipoprotein diacylglyceryl transferase [Eubacterium sp. am_0171]|uniref:Phosphatidylglycerol--prolipoprotein diacylglyceryl transferase n=1 Tax=Faecalicatena contorta TaxID=39482 RepID=A0A173ZNU1_9FIRM|nr:MULTISPECIES: prolipoprotein diacylglyceryl transferase [Clostridia]MSC84866.1 prolipoprotein diacylglyceryl transferase [Eubacterium sp. BIOML-A1]MSD07154.1 prolipoprotein diacylglyceryl transferase [Eubacterium sp. BIOML-A2]RYT16066.1 prolipoprotein diacylglyceryl transferase [Eubacterium sp. am_0171]CUN76888.1 Prolipoprotein diacylglyceryl transferase [[Eubacterium] contortum] [Faecalicatena contorta]
MHYNINFPHLGIHLEHVEKSITVFGFEIAFYGIIIGCAILIGFLIATSEAKRTRQNPEDYLDMGIIGVVCGIAGARLYYVVFSWDMYKDNLLDILNLREGGLGIYGGVIAAVITVIICAKVKRLNAPQIFDTVALAILNGQMLGRWGNFFNREAFGEYTDSLFAMQLPLDAVRDSDVTETMRANMQVVDGVSYIQVHPTFLYESVWCLILFIILFLYRKHKKYEGELFLLYLFGYGLGRVWIEGLRTDQLLIPGIGFPVSQLLAGLIVVVTGGLLIYLWRNHKRMPFLRSGRKYEPLPDKPVGKKRPKAKDRLFK